MNILGLNIFHGDSSAALLQDGKVVAAVEEERFTRVKHWAGVPMHSIRYCLAAGGISLGDISHVAVSFNPKANLKYKLKFLLKNRPSLKFLLKRFSRVTRSASIEEQIAQALGESESTLVGKVVHVEHHLAHVASSFFTSPFEKSAIASIDGMGDFVSTLTAAGEDLNIQEYDRVYYPDSLGFLYNALTLYLGFPSYGDEYKVMGLAPYGEAQYMDLLRDMVSADAGKLALNLRYFTHHKEGISMAWDSEAPKVDPFHSPYLEEKFGPQRKKDDPIEQRHKDFAASLQLRTEEVIYDLLNRLYEKYPCENLCLAGGVAMNSVANGKIVHNTPFSNVYIPPGAADNGTAFGAALWVWHKQYENPRGNVLPTGAYLGPDLDDAECREVLEAAEVRFTKYSEDELASLCVDALVEGGVVGWARGRMEFGARALGCRSILADPRRADMRDIINSKIKFRESFRPFAPSILEERVDEYFESPAPSPYMERVLPIKEEKHSVIPAVTHVDGTGRLQSVSRKTNPRYWNLIHEFEKRTGIPILLNTSFNENEPIVCTPKEALDCFLRTSMDILILGDYHVQRPLEPRSK